MRHQIGQVFRSGKFLTGFIIFGLILLLVVVYPLINPGDPLQMIGLGSFIRPGTYVSLYDGFDIEAHRVTDFRLPDATQNRIDSRLSFENRQEMRGYLLLAGIDEAGIDIDDIESLLALWWEHYDPALNLGNTLAERRNFSRIDNRVRGLFYTDDYIVMEVNPETGEYEQKASITTENYVNVDDIANVVYLPLGTDNFGMDMLKKLVAAIVTSLQIGLIAGTIATIIGLTLGLLAGYLSGIVDDIIMFFCNLFTVIPGIVLLILISYGLGQEQRGAVTVAVVIGFTSWVWTARSVRSQVLSLRDRDHVNLSKLSGHSMPRIIVRDVLPYLASYVVMAFILQVSSGILAEAGLSMLGLGPKTTEVPTLGLMLNWAMTYTAHLSQAWWAYVPIVLVIALISFSLNLMNTGLDQIFNPQLRD